MLSAKGHITDRLLTVLSAVGPVPAKARTLKNVVLPSHLAAPGVCTLTAASMPEAKRHASLGCKEITLKR